MWAISPGMFVSVVEKESDQDQDTLTVRARDRASLVEFCRLAEIDDVDDVILEQTVTDYPFRLVAWRAEVERAAVNAVTEIRYSNFKNAAETVRGKGAFTRFLSRVWIAGLSLTPYDVAERGGSVYYGLDDFE